MFTRPGVEPITANRSDWRKSSTAFSDSNVYTPPKIPSARSASQTFEASPGTAAKAGASSSHELTKSSSESPSRLKFTIRICTATSSVRAGGPQDDDDVPPSCADEDLMRIGLPWSVVLVEHQDRARWTEPPSPKPSPSSNGPPASIDPACSHVRRRAGQ